MTKSGIPDRRQYELDLLVQRADREWEAGNLRRAFRLLLAAAKAGDDSAQMNLGTFYSNGIGVKANRKLALQWYRRAHRRGNGAAASNIGIVLLSENKLTQALAWFERAVGMGEIDANLDIAKIHIQRADRAKAIHYLKEVRKARPRVDVTEASWEEAGCLLKRLRTSRSGGLRP